MQSTEVVSQLAKQGILANTEGEMVRLVTNLDLHDEDITKLCTMLENFQIEADA